MRDDPVGQVTERVTHDAPADRRRLDEADGMVLARRGALQVDCPLDEVDVDDLASTRPLVAVVGVERQTLFFIGGCLAVMFVAIYLLYVRK